MSWLVDRILNLHGFVVYFVVTLLVFAEDAIFVGFVIPGETAAVLSGVLASQGNIKLWLILILVIAAAIVGDSVGYEIGRKVGPRILSMRVFDKRRKRLDDAQDFLRRRGGSAVFLGRFVAFFRAVMPALAGTARMPYRKFLFFNALGGIVWGSIFVLLGYFAGASYKTIERVVGRGTAIGVVVIVLIVIVVWQVRKHRADRDPSSRTDSRPDRDPVAESEG